MTKRFTKLDIIIALILFFIPLLIYWHFIVPCPTHVGDIISNIYPAKLLVDEKAINMYNPLNEKYNTFGFAPFGNYRTQTEIYSSKAPGGITFFAFVMFFGGEKSFYYLNGFFGAICVVLCYFWCKKLTDSRAYGIIGAITLFTMPVFVKWSIDNYANIIMVAFLIFGFICLILLKKEIKYLFSGIFLAIAIFIRPEAIFLVLPFLLYLYLNKVKIMSYVNFLIPIIITVGIIYPLMNYYLYGDPFFMGGLGSRWPSTVIGSVNPVDKLIPFLSWYKATPALQQTMIYFFTANFAFPLLLPSLLGIIILFKYNKNVGLFILFLGFVSWLFYGKGLSYGLDQSNLHASFLRYMLPFYLLLPIGVAYFFGFFLKVMKSRPVRILYSSVFVLILMSSLAYGINYETYGIKDLNDHQKWILDAKSEILDVTNPDDIFVSDIYGRKILFPQRKNIFYFPRVPQEIRYPETERVIKELLNDNRTVYLVIATFPEDTINMLDFMNEKFILKKRYFKNTSYIMVYKITNHKDGEDKQCRYWT